MSQSSQPWSEKYRPRTLNDVAAQDAVIETLNRTLEAANLPHMLFYGPPGTGKTSTILALARDLFGPELAKQRVLELNASNERGIAIVRTKIKDFAKTMVTTPSAEARSKYPCPPFKIIILDEADSMTQDAQAALRRIMEASSSTTRFCLVCNYVTRIIDPLVSRCSKFRFGALGVDSALSRLEHICELESAPQDKETLVRLLQVTKGDLRRAITLLQTAHMLYKPEKIPVSLIDELSGTVPAEKVDSLGKLLQSKPDWPGLRLAVEHLTLEGWSVANIIQELHNKIINDATVPDRVKCALAAVFSEADARLCESADEGLTLLNVGITATKAFSN